MRKEQGQQLVYSPTSQKGLSEGQNKLSTHEAKIAFKFLYDNLETRIKERQ